MYRSNSYNSYFSKEMRDPEFARHYLMELINDEDEPMSIESALKFVIKQMGTTDFAKLVNERKQTIDKFLKGTRNPKRATLDTILKAFGLVSVIKVKQLDDKKAA